MNDSFSSAKDLINTYFSNISESSKKFADLESTWRNILIQIRSICKQQDTKRFDIGSQLADHSKIIDFKNGTLFVETDHPTRLQMLYLYKNYILDSLRKKYPELKINNVSFFIGKQKKQVSSALRDVSSVEMEKAIEKRTQNLESSLYEQNVENPKKDIPEEVKALFKGFLK